MKIVKIIYKCNGCGIETKKPYESRFREFTKGRGMKKKKIHLCPVCYHSLDKMFEMSEEVENNNAQTPTFRRPVPPPPPKTEGRTSDPCPEIETCPIPTRETNTLRGREA